MNSQMQLCGRRRFNPRARVGRDAYEEELDQIMLDVSIHAPAWGATRARFGSVPENFVSIHAPAWGATLLSSTDNDSAKCFNPRARVGRDIGTEQVS